MENNSYYYFVQEGRRMKRFFCVIGFIFLVSCYSWSQTVSYKAGEKVIYSIQYAFIPAGSGTLELKSDTFNGNEVLHSKLSARTTGMAETLFKVLDIYESYMDPVTGLPVKSIRNIREGHYKRYNVVLFDHKTRADSSILNSDLTGIHIAPPR
ncbi:MAG TPA: DUF3108 domain-containing protein, partial [Bacteroidales bacterium]